MKNIKKSICFILAALMLLCAVPFSAGATKITDYEVGDIVEFGSYPQSKVNDKNAIAALNRLAGDYSTWTSYNYYSGTGSWSDGNMAASDYMKYTDVDYNGYKFRGVKFTSYRPSFTGDISSKETSNQYDNGYYTNTVYWFKYEPIKWRVLNPDSGLVIAENGIDSQAINNYVWYGIGYKSTVDNVNCYYGDSAHTYYASDYANSSIKQWLNDDFYNTAFTDTQKNKITSTLLYNRSYPDSDEYSSATTTDKIYLLSYAQTLNDSYGFSSTTEASETRTLECTDYAKCQGVYYVSGTNTSPWCLRTAKDSQRVWTPNYSGKISDILCSQTDFAIRPAMNIDLNSDAFSYKLTFNANGGSGIPTKYSVHEDNTVVIPAKTPTKSDGYAFKCWTDSLLAKTRTIKAKPGDVITLTKDTTLYALYEEAPTSISIVSPPTKTNYEYGEELDITGLVVSAVHRERTIEVDNNDLIITGYDRLKEGTNTVTVTYLGQSATFDVNVETSSVTAHLVSISVKSLPNKTTYFIGEEFDPTGLVLTGTNSDGSSGDFSTGYTYTGFDSSTAGTKTITISRYSKTTTFDINVIPNYDIKTLGTKGGVKYNQIVTLNVNLPNLPEGSVVKINGETVSVNNGTVTKNFGRLTSDKSFTVKVFYGDKELDSEEGTITVPHGFFDKLAAFFSKLFQGDKYATTVNF